MADRLEPQERSVQRFLELNGDDFPAHGATGEPIRVRAQRSLAAQPPPLARHRRPRHARRARPSASSARCLTTENRERDAIFSPCCSARPPATSAASWPGCAAAHAARAAQGPRRSCRSVTGAGAVKIARLDSGTSYTLGTSTGTSRVVWVHGVDSRPIVQCVGRQTPWRAADRTLR